MDGMAYEQNISKRPKAVKGKPAASLEDLRLISTPTLLWALVKRHKFGLFVTLVTAEHLYLAFNWLGII